MEGGDGGGGGGGGGGSDRPCGRMERAELSKVPAGIPNVGAGVCIFG